MPEDYWVLLIEMEQIRSFIAIELPEDIKTALSRLQAQLKSGNNPYVKWADPYGVHLTLKFLGNIAVNITDEITRVMTTVAGDIPPVHLEVRELGVFPNLNRVQVVWVGITGEAARLQQLQQRLESALAPLGFTAESRPFKPHLTLARVGNRVTPDERRKLGQLIAGTRFGSTHSFRVDTINLMKSQLTRTGAIYSRISSVRLGKSCPPGER